MADGDALPSASASSAAASPRSPAPPETPSTQKRRQRGLMSRVWKGIFGGREDIEKLLWALSKEEEAVRSRLHHRTRASRQSAHNVLALAAALELTIEINILLKNFVLKGRPRLTSRRRERITILLNNLYRAPLKVIL